MCNSEQQAPAAPNPEPVTQLEAFVDDIRAMLWRWQSEGKALALATLVNVEGKSPRPIGSQMLVTEQGASVGLISGGCIESAIVEEARLCIKAGKPHLVRYGKGSDYIDIHLPCGSGLDIYIQPLQGAPWVADLQNALVERKEIYWTVALESGAVALTDPHQAKASLLKNPQLSRAQRHQLKYFVKQFRPRIRVAVYGSGAVFDYFVAMAALLDLELIKLEPGAHKQDASAWLHDLDSYSAFVCLLHEHEAEVALLANVLSRPVFYVAALGSALSHAKRIEGLKAMHCSDGDIMRVKGPAGIDLGAKNPVEIATSILAELIERKNKRLTS